MVRTTRAGSSVIGLLLVLAGAQAIHWLLTPGAHTDVSSARVIAVGLQALAGFAGGAWVLWRAWRLRRDAALVHSC